MMTASLPPRPSTANMAARARPLRRWLPQPAAVASRREGGACQLPELDRRSTVRISSRRVCSWRVIDLAGEEPVQRGRFHDLSEDGIGLIVNRRLRPGQFLVIATDVRAEPPATL